jgi:uncharacterized protein
VLMLKGVPVQVRFSAIKDCRFYGNLFFIQRISMIAVFVNCGAVIFGSLLGLLLSRKITQTLSDNIQTAAGIVVLILGLQMAFKYQNIVYLTLSLISGGLLGTWWDVDGQILRFGNFLERAVAHSKKDGRVPYVAAERSGTGKNFAYAFLNASVLFCVGAMAIVGSFKAAIEKDYTIIFTKSILDGFMAVTFAAAMGLGTVFSALSVLLYQGALTLLSFVLKPYVTDQMVNELTGVGGALIVMIGINLIGLRKIKTANYLPAMLVEILFVVLDPYIHMIVHL